MTTWSNKLPTEEGLHYWRKNAESTEFKVFNILGEDKNEARLLLERIAQHIGGEWLRIPSPDEVAALRERVKELELDWPTKENSTPITASQLAKEVEEQLITMGAVMGVNYATAQTEMSRLLDTTAQTAAELAKITADRDALALRVRELEKELAEARRTPTAKELFEVVKFYAANHFHAIPTIHERCEKESELVLDWVEEAYNDLLREKAAPTEAAIDSAIEGEQG